VFIAQTICTPRSRHLQELTVAQLVKKFPTLSLSSSQEPTTGLYHEPHETRPNTHILFLMMGIFHFTTASRTALGPTQPPIQRVPWALSPGVKRPRREADHSPPSSSEVKNAWSYTSTPQYVYIKKKREHHISNCTTVFRCGH
jgi:hypothetical protein